MISIKYKLLIFIFVPMMVIFVFGLSYVKDNVRQVEQSRFMQEQTNKLTRLESKIESNIKFFINHTKILSNLLSQKMDKEAMTSLLQSYLYSVDELVELTFVALNSMEVARVNKYHIIEPQQKSYFKDNFYRYTLTHNSLYVDDVRISIDTGEPLVDIAFLVIDKLNAKKLGIIKATFSASKNWDSFETEIDSFNTIGSLNLSNNTLLTRYGKDYPNLVTLLLDSQKQTNKDLFIFTKNIKLTKSQILLYLIVPKIALEQKIEAFERKYISNFFIFLALFLIIIFVTFQYYTAKLSKASKDISHLARRLSGTLQKHEIKKDEFANLHQSITLLQVAITDSQKKDQLLQQQSKLASMGEMIGAIAHQWRQPLNALNINIQNLEEDYEEGLIDAEFIEEFMTKNRNIIVFMSKTIDDFRNFFRIDKEKSAFSILESITEVVTIQSAQLKNHNISLDIKGDDFEINGYRSEFGQVLLNLINNSKDAIVEHNIKDGIIQIELNSHEILIADNGGGIPQDVIDRVFEPYFTTKEQGKGTGLGLYMSKMIIEENMGGKLSVRNEENCAIFTISFQSGVSL